ncbi:hypothetical protein GT348_07275 [Aristophania vespae]|uniref:Uncharacterized protein n=1 Tax=Aristophania vespae TaxID=2697033 RepID=A0A6P1NFJ4_9PROT|nr:hypothetical protein [Aristophania vespae]QHI96063.1 hypothetical protein GT348_07275 [Aristophania vespae]
MKQFSTIYRSIRPQATVTAIVFSYGSDLSAVTDHTPQHKQVTGRHGKAWHRHKSVAQK